MERLGLALVHMEIKIIHWKSKSSLIFEYDEPKQDVIGILHTVNKAFQYFTTMLQNTLNGVFVHNED